MSPRPLDRRTMIATLASGIALPVAAQPRPPVVGFLGFATPQANLPMVDALRRGLREQGYVEGQTIVVDVRHANGDLKVAERDIDELIARGTAVFVAPGPAAVRIVVQKTSTPVVGIGLVPSLSGTDPFGSIARPGGSVTGFSTYGEELSGKRIELLRRVLPDARVLGILHNVADPVFHQWGELTERAARSQGLRTIRLGLKSSSDAELSQLLRELKQQNGNTLIVVRDFLTAGLVKPICSMALELGIAVVAEERVFAQEGGLVSYGPVIEDLLLRAAGYVSRILKGAKPADLPIQLPTKFELCLNLATARRLGLPPPPADVLFAANEVIE